MSGSAPAAGRSGRHARSTRLLLLALLVLGSGTLPALDAYADHDPAPTSEGVYRVPYANGTQVRVTRDHHDHSPVRAEGGAGAHEPHGRGHAEDVREPDHGTRDGDLDLVLHLPASDSGVQPDTTTPCVVGTTAGGATSFGCDEVVVRPA